MLLTITKENYANEILASVRTVLLDFYADWCGPCKMVAPIIEEIAEQRPDIKVGKINVDMEQELAAEFGISSIPTLIVIKDGKVTSKAVGSRTKEQILKMLV